MNPPPEPCTEDSELAGYEYDLELSCSIYCYIVLYMLLVARYVLYFGVGLR